MAGLARNQALAREVVHRLRRAGVTTFCLCPGGRNAPLVEVLASASPPVEVLDFFEERSAAYFALGRARRDRRPAAVVTTSGTAAAELLPAMVEARYAGVPLVAVTADRPRSYRGTGAPQAIEQAELFGVYASTHVDLDEPGGEWSPSTDGPSHVNVAFDEPLLGDWQDEPEGPAADDEGVPPAAAPPAVPAGDRFHDGARDALRGASRPLVVLGSLDETDREDVLALCRELAAPVLAETSSHLKARLGPLLLRSGESVARRFFDSGSFDGVLRLGDVPSCRLWRDLESALQVPVLSISRRPWPGLTRGVHRRVEPGTSLSSCVPALPAFPADRREDIVRADAREATLIDELLEAYPRSEPALVRRLSGVIPRHSFVYLGNSQPVREWNDFAAVEERGFSFGENRGANGIDGQLSTFFGWAREGFENWAIVGDLTALYDLASPWSLRCVRGTVRIVVLNNGGGRIFERMFRNERFQNRHAVTFEAWAALWGLEYCREIPVRWGRRPGIIELQPDEGETAAFWRARRSGSEG